MITDLRSAQLTATSSSYSALTRLEVDIGPRAGPLTPSSTGREATSNVDSVNEMMGVETSLDRGLPTKAAKTALE